MKLAIICFNLDWQAGGVRLIYSFAHEALNLGHKVIIYAPRINESAYPDLREGLDIRVINPPKPILWQYQSNNLLKRIKEKLRRNKALISAGNAINEAMDTDFDIINVHDFSYQIAAQYKKKNPAAKIIWTMNDPPYMYLPKNNFFYNLVSKVYNIYKDIIEQKYFKFIDAVVVLVSRNKQWAERRGMRAKIIWSGLDFKRFYAPIKNIENKKEYTLLGVGALNKYRRFEDIIDAVYLLRKVNINVRAIIICKNIWQENKYKEELVTHVKTIGLESYIDFHFDGASDEELKHFYSISDFFILPIHLPPPRDGFGWQLVPFEAMAAGTLVILSRKIDISEALKDKETAWFVDPLKPEQITSAIKNLIKNPIQYKTIAQKGQELVKNKMSWKKYAEEIINLSSSS